MVDVVVWRIDVDVVVEGPACWFRTTTAPLPVVGQDDVVPPVAADVAQRDHLRCRGVGLRDPVRALGVEAVIRRLGVHRSRRPRAVDHDQVGAVVAVHVGRGHRVGAVGGGVAGLGGQGPVRPLGEDLGPAAGDVPAGGIPDVEPPVPVEVTDGDTRAAPVGGGVDDRRDERAVAPIGVHRARGRAGDDVRPSIAGHVADLDLDEGLDHHLHGEANSPPPGRSTSTRPSKTVVTRRS